MTTILQRLRKQAGFGTFLGRMMGGTAGRAIGKAVTRPGTLDRAAGAVAGGFLGSDQGARATGTEGGSVAGMAGGAALGGMYGLSGTRMRGNAAAHVAAPMVRNALIGGSAGEVADTAARAAGYDTNLSGMAAAGGLGLGAARRIAPNAVRQVSRAVPQAANEFMTGAQRPFAAVGDKIYQGARRLAGKSNQGYSPLGNKVATPMTNALGAKPAPGGQRMAHNLGMAAGAVPLAAGAYGVAGDLATKGLNSAADTVGQNIRGQIDDHLNQRLPELADWAKEQGNDFLHNQVAQAGPGIVDRITGGLRSRGLLNSDGRIAVDMSPDWMRHPTQSAPAKWMQATWDRYANRPTMTGQGYH